MPTSIITLDVDVRSQVLHIPLADGDVLVVVKGPLGRPMFYRWSHTLRCIEVVRVLEA